MDWKLLVIILPVGYFLLRVVESLILNVAGNILTDPIRNWIANKWLSSKRKRVDQLQKELNDVTKLYEDRNKLYLHIFQNGLFLFGLAIGSVISLIIFVAEKLQQVTQSAGAISTFWSLMFDIFFFILLAAFMILWNSMLTLIGRVIKYDSYKIQVEKQIGELSKKQSTINKVG